VVLFSTCTVEYNEPGVGQAALRVLAHNGIKAVVPEGQRCCGMPALDGGDVEGALERARANIGLLAPYVAEGKRIIALQPTCSYVLKEEYPMLVEGDVARQVADATVDLTDYLAGLAREGKLKTDFQEPVGPLTYHVSCHTRALGGGARGRDLLKLIPDTEVVMVEQCAGIDGTWGLKAEFFDEAKKVARRLDRAIGQHPGHHMCSDCKLAGLQIEDTAGHAPSHPVEVLARAYGLPIDA
jgi:Fe-S oxidoreductase